MATPGGPARDTIPVYRPRARQLDRGNTQVAEIDVLALPRRALGAFADPKLPDGPAPVPPPGFALSERKRAGHYLLLRFRAGRPRVVRANRMPVLGGQAAAVFVEPS